ncbi:MAG: serine/threonine-protein phosphatase [Treponemataceae bacterium]|nr:serine/threonine-protein phosphatase [Treponemataceae bacterium]
MSKENPLNASLKPPRLPYLSPFDVRGTPSPQERSGPSMEELFIEVGYYQEKKHGQGAAGDVFLSKKTSDGHLISVLSDGLGSGIKAGVLATLTATMAIQFVAEDIPIQRAARIIMKTLPVCKERNISYATFTIVNIDGMSRVRIIEYDNPPYVLIRQSVDCEPIKKMLVVHRRGLSKTSLPEPSTNARMYYSSFEALPGDRLVFFSDGIPQSGMGSTQFPLGWGNPAVHRYIQQEVREHPHISARELAQRLVVRALLHDGYRALDDITCGVIYFRKPRRLLVLSGPPIDPSRDRELADLFDRFPGKKVVCGGTTATIIGRELGRSVRVCLKNITVEVPPTSEMEGADLVTEGIITLGKAAELLNQGPKLERPHLNGATRLVDLFLDSDHIDFVIGTKINEAHQDPSMPVELEIRRNIVKRIASLLEERYLKKTTIRFI